MQLICKSAVKVRKYKHLILREKRLLLHFEEHGSSYWVVYMILTMVYRLFVW
jgi:hypothetical protein